MDRRRRPSAPGLSAGIGRLLSSLGQVLTRLAGSPKLRSLNRPFTPREWTVAVYAVLVLYAIAAGAFAYAPYRTQLSDLRVELHTARAEVAYARQCEARHGETESRIAELTAASEQLRRRLPAGPDEVTFIYRCWQWARATGVTVETVSLAPPSPVGAGQDQVVNLSLTGPYGTQVAFLARLEGGEPLAKVERTTLVPATQGSLLRGDYVVHIFSGNGPLTVPEVVKAGVHFTRTAGRGDPFSP